VPWVHCARYSVGQQRLRKVFEKQRCLTLSVLLIVSHRLLSCGFNQGMFQLRCEFYGFTISVVITELRFNMGIQHSTTQQVEFSV